MHKQLHTKTKRLRPPTLPNQRFGEHKTIIVSSLCAAERSKFDVWLKSAFDVQFIYTQSSSSLTFAFAGLLAFYLSFYCPRSVLGCY